jgi:hypothetical protein
LTTPGAQSVCASASVAGSSQIIAVKRTTVESMGGFL